MELSLNLAEVGILDPIEAIDNGLSIEILDNQVDEMFLKVDQLEQNLKEVEQFYASANKKQLTTPKGISLMKDREKLISSFKRRSQDAARRESAANERMQELMRQFGILISQTNHNNKLAAPFMEPVDVVGLKLDDYYKVIEKPMDFSTIKNKMEAKDGNGYKNVREIWADVRLIFKNAMKYNDDRDDVHVMAKSLLGKFEEKWLQLLPKVDEEEKRRKEEEAEAQFDIQLAQEAAHAKLARELSAELDDVDMQLDEFRDIVLQNCRMMSIEEKRKLGTILTRLSPEDLNKALFIVAENNPNFDLNSEDVDLNMDKQSESTLWKLKLFVKDRLQAGGKNINGSWGGNNNAATATAITTTATTTTTLNNQQNINNKRRREICVALAKTTLKKPKKDH